MKTIFKTILSVFALLASATMLVAQEKQTVPDKFINKDGLVYSKQVQGPNDKGEYSIFLKSFITGTVTEETIHIPSDIILVLDVSGSMNYNMYSPTESRRWTTSDINSGTYYYLYTGSGTGSGNYYQVYTSGNTIGYYRNNRWRDLSSNGSWTGVLHTLTGTRMDALQDAVDHFITQVKKDADDNNQDNQIAIVKFASATFYDQKTIENETSTTATGNHKYATGGSNSGNMMEFGANNFDNTGYYNVTEIVKGFTPVRTQESSLKTAVQQLRPGGTTAADYGIHEAKLLLNTLYSNGNPNRVSNKMVIFFTDGDPTHSSNFQEAVANTTINAAKEIKAKTAYTYTDSDGKVTTGKVKVYTIGTFSNPDANTTLRYMQRVSSNYPDATGMGTNDGGQGSDTGGYYFAATNAEELKNAFDTISGDAASSDIDLGTSSTVVDVVSKSFNLPTGTDASSVQIWTADCIGRGSDNQYAFEAQYDDDDVLQWDNITHAPGIELVQGTTAEPNKVTVKGYDFEANMCARNPDGSYRGKVLILEIPIIMNEDAVGGHGVGTNAPGSGIQYKKADGSTGLIEFTTPDISLPINLHIRKEGLQLGESARFTIQRKLVGDGEDLPDDEEIPAENEWQNYTTVFVTRRSTDAESGENAPIVKIVGLHPDFIYRIKEEDWSWSYSISSVYGYNIDPETETTSQVTMQNGTAADFSDNTVTSDKINMNPFIFVNAKKDVESSVITVRHAESLVRNEFKDFPESGKKQGVTTNSKTQ